MASPTKGCNGPKALHQSIKHYRRANYKMNISAIPCLAKESAHTLADYLTQIKT